MPVFTLMRIWINYTFYSNKTKSYNCVVTQVVVICRGLVTKNLIKTYDFRNNVRHKEY